MDALIFSSLFAHSGVIAIILFVILPILALLYLPIYGFKKYGFKGFLKEIFYIKPGTFKIAKPVIREDAMY